MKNRKLLILGFAFAAFPLISQAQDEVIVPLRSNNVIKAAIAQKSLNVAESKISSVLTDTLFLPFFDDFSVASVWPSADRWTDSTAFINYNFPINPPTLGAATFDGLDAQGNPYNNTNANANGLCDVMTSRAINLFNDNNGIPYNSSDSLFLIFYYQRKGRGDNPETTDSLTLQFFDISTQLWVPVWKATGATSGDTSFTKVKISINDPAFRQNGFRFRFRNFGSLTGMLDIWNVDYVSLNKFLPSSYENVRDYAYVNQGFSLLNNYSSIPWTHFSSLSTAQQQARVKTTTDLTIRNNNDAISFPIKVAGNIIDQYNNSTAIIGGGGLNSIVIPINSNLGAPVNLLSNSFFVDPTVDEETAFTAVYDLGQTSGGIVDDYPQNDTLKYRQFFGKYYSYDDGSAELAYGVSGVGAQLAYKFEVLKGDTLRSVDMFFAQSGVSVSNLIFKLAIWTGTTVPVGAPVFQKFNQTPNYIDSINGFYSYTTPALYLPPGTYFFGYIQNIATILNLGLDINTPADPSRKFINVNGNWTPSQLPGMWMIRPVFSSSPLINGVNDINDDLEFSVYPIPAHDVIHISFDNPDSARMKMKVLDVTGRSVIEEADFNNQLHVDELSAGIYFLHISDPVTGTHMSKKLVIAGK